MRPTWLEAGVFAVEKVQHKWITVIWDQIGNRFTSTSIHSLTHNILLKCDTIIGHKAVVSKPLQGRILAEKDRAMITLCVKTPHFSSLPKTICH